MTQPPPDYDLNETVVTEKVVTANTGMTPTTRLLLIALGVLALAGLAWWLLHRAAPAPVAIEQPPVVAGTNPGTTPVAPGTTTPEGTAPTVPPLPGDTNTTDPNGTGTADPTDPTPQPEGINPDQKLTGLNGSNPFKPGSLPVDPNAVAAAPTQPAAATPPDNITAPKVTITPPASSAAEINAALNSAGTGKPTTTNATGTKSNTTGVVVTQKPAVNPVSQRPNGSLKQGTPTTAAASQGSNSTKPATPAPVKPPIAGVSAPGNIGMGNMGTGSATGNSSMSGTSSDLPAPGLPPVLGNVNGGVPTNSTPTPTQPDTSRIDSYLSTNKVTLNGAVLGPNSTAILKTSQGFVIASVGQLIQGTDIVLKSVTTDSATLSVGNQTKTISLDNKVSHE